jgi:hypothetical protein
MQDQHLANVIAPKRGADGFAGMVEEFICRRFEGCVAFTGCVDFFTQSAQDGGQVGFKLHYGLAELCYLRPHIAKEQVQKLFQPLDIGHVAASNLRAVLPQDSRL